MVDEHKKIEVTSMISTSIYFTMPKIGDTNVDIQDSISFRSFQEADRLAIADGVSTSFLPKIWADLLVKKFCCSIEDPIKDIEKSWIDWLFPLQLEWEKEALEFRKSLSRKIEEGEKINIFSGCSRYKDHASATFLGLELSTKDINQSGTWRSVAIGDSCLFHIRKNPTETKYLSWPYEKSSDFSIVTESFQSCSNHNSFQPKFYQGTYENGDIFLLATDALAEWILHSLESSNSKWENLLKIENEQEFMSFIENLRNQNLIKDDDTTFCRRIVRFEESFSTETSTLDKASSKYVRIQKINKLKKLICVPSLLTLILSLSFYLSCATKENFLL
jgi:hypothetical protein